MRLLLDTHLLLWVVAQSSQLSVRANDLVQDPRNEVFFSAVSLWEIGIKHALHKAGFEYQASAVRLALIDNGYNELDLTGRQSLSLAALPLIHKDPFDRMLIVQAAAEGLVLVTSDRQMSTYPGEILLV